MSIPRALSLCLDAANGSTLVRSASWGAIAYDVARPWAVIFATVASCVFIARAFRLLRRAPSFSRQLDRVASEDHVTLFRRLAQLMRVAP